MFNKNDPLLDSVKSVMKENEIRREAERKLNEELGIASKKALPFEHYANYDALLEQKIKEALHPNQQKLDVHEPEKDELTAQDFKMLRAKKKVEEESKIQIIDKEGFINALKKGKKKSENEKSKKEPMKEAAPMTGDTVQGSGTVTKGGKDVVSKTATPAEGPSDKERAALTNKVKEVMKEESLEEKAPEGAKFERMVKHIKKKYAKDGLTKKEKSIAYATAWKAKNKEEMKESVLAELKAKLGEEAFNAILEGMAPNVSIKQAEKTSDAVMNDPKPDDYSAVKKSPNVNIKAAQGTANQLEEQEDDLDKATKSVSAINKNSVAADNNSPSGRAAGMGAEFGNDERTQPAKPAASSSADIKSALGDTGPKSVTSMPTPKPAAPAPAAKPAAPAPRAKTPAARPAAPAAKLAAPAPAKPMGGPDDDTSPLAAMRQYQASKEAGAFDNKPAAPAAKPAARPAPRPAARAPMPPTGRPTAAAPQRMARGGVMAESLEQTIKNMLKD